MAYDTHPHLAPSRKRGGVTWEYRIYFALILLLIALPTALWQWTAGALLPRGAASNTGLMHRALSEAHTITTLIFSA